VIDRPGPDRSLVFQDNALYPWRTVFQNVAYGLEIQGLSKEQTAGKVHEWLDRVGLAEFRDYYPRELSGGMQQRVALARALVLNPPVLPLDEPFGALDAMTRMEMQLELLHLWKQSKSTVVLITHDVEEALFLADTVLVLSPRPGRIALEIPITEPRPRDRGAPKLALARREILAHSGLNRAHGRVGGERICGFLIL
jgi:NitT/TauT family transport system ATP-binding protein